MSQSQTPALASAYAFCRAVARREAKNFYWAFRVLPKHKSDAMCAVYAFMRRADDLADDESLPLEARRAAMAAWTDSWRASRETPGPDPVFLALRDTQQRFGISNDLLEQLVAGTTMDLNTEPLGTRTLTLGSDTTPQTVQIYDTQAALEQYCYLVASVVGLVCIRIFGYTDPNAEVLAIDTGKAFQLTNVLRDVKEDAERGRIYLPLELLSRFGVTPERLLQLTAGEEPCVTEVEMLQSLGDRAEALYRSATTLVPLLDPDSRPAMEVLYTIYHRLLQRIATNYAQVYKVRVSVPTGEKLVILSKGIVGSLGTRRRA